MVRDSQKRILTVNSGSSSIKFSLYDIGSTEEAVLSGILSRISLGDGLFRATDNAGKTLIEERLQMPDHERALNRLLSWLCDFRSIDGIGHRIVHGGVKYKKPVIIDSAIKETLEGLIPFAPEHLPHEIKAVGALMDSYPETPQVACFDTAFHRHMPRLAQLYPLPENLRRDGVIRYGFHGLSYEYIMERLAGDAGQTEATGRVVIAHLGNGASMAAVKGGRSMDTTMGLTPTGGLMMSRRSGDLDPGVEFFLLKNKKMTPDELYELLNERSGLLGVSSISPDMKDLEDKEDKDGRAALAIELFCYTAKKFLGSLAAVLGGLDILVFTAGIGENSWTVRKRICSGMEFLGIKIDDYGNSKNNTVISTPDSKVTVRVIKTNEELMIARHTYRLISSL